MPTILLYTYHCIDGVVRTRCARHMERTGPYRILGQPYNVRTAPPTACIRCFWLRHNHNRNRP